MRQIRRLAEGKQLAGHAAGLEEAHVQPWAP